MYLNDVEPLISDDAARELARSIRRYQFAAEQDANPLVAATHNGYAVALVEYLRNVSTPEQVLRVTGQDLAELRRRVLAFQDKVENMGIKVAEAIKAKGLDPEKLVRGLLEA